MFRQSIPLSNFVFIWKKISPNMFNKKGKLESNAEFEYLKRTLNR